MKKKVIKRILFTILAIVIALTGYVYIGMVLTPKDFSDRGGKKYFAMTAYKREKENSLDVMMYGNSDLYNGVNSMEIYNQLGVTAYNCGASNQTVNAIRKQIKKSLKRQKLKCVILETDCFYFPNQSWNGSAAYENTTFTAPFLYHARWKELEFKDFFTRPVLKTEDNFLKGYVFEKNVGEFDYNEMVYGDPNDPAQKLEKSVLKDFKKIYKMCKEKNIPILLMELPSANSWNYARHNSIQQLVDKYNQQDENYQLKFIDFNFNPNRPKGFDYTKHFRDNGNHLNYFGAQVVTKKLCEYMRANFDFEDRRNDLNYAEWNKCLEKYQNYIRQML